jgi:hypothetical protein
MLTRQQLQQQGTSAAARREDAGPSKSSTSSVGTKRKQSGAEAQTKRLKADQNLSHIFATNEIVAQNNKFKLEIVKTAFNHNNRFSLDDHLFVLKCKLKKRGKKPVLFQLLNLLYNGLVHTLNKLKEHYKNPEHEYQMYSTVVEGHIKNGLNTGTYLLNGSDYVTVTFVLFF